MELDEDNYFNGDNEDFNILLKDVDETILEEDVSIDIMLRKANSKAKSTRYIKITKRFKVFLQELNSEEKREIS